MKKWLKYGLIGAIIHLVFFLFMVFLMVLIGIEGVGYIFVFIEVLPAVIIFNRIDTMMESNTILAYFLIGLIMTIFWFIIGTIIGKIKSRNNTISQNEQPFN